MLVLDGPEVTDLSNPLILWVGVDDPDEAVPTGARSSQTWAGIGAQRKDEQLAIFCTARAWSGDTDVRAVREAAYGIVGAVENLVRANANLGGTVLVTLSGVSGLRLRQPNTAQGAVAEVGFQIDAKARI